MEIAEAIRSAAQSREPDRAFNIRTVPAKKTRDFGMDIRLFREDTNWRPRRSLEDSIQFILDQLTENYTLRSE